MIDLLNKMAGDTDISIALMEASLKNNDSATYQKNMASLMDLDVNLNKIIEASNKYRQ